VLPFYGRIFACFDIVDICIELCCLSMDAFLLVLI
jgi:hypothetical protein